MGEQFVGIRNALIILMKVLSQFPLYANMAKVIETRVETVRDREKEKRQDLYVLAMSYYGALKMRKGFEVKF